MASKEILHSVHRNVQVLKNSVEENWRIRRHLALAYRILDRLNLNEGACNHLTAKAPSQIPGEEDVMLVIPGIMPDGSALHWSKVTASSLLGLNRNQDIIEPGSLGGIPEESAACIHTGFRRIQPDSKVLFHTHTDYATALGCVEPCQFPMIHQNGVRFYNRFAFHTNYGLPTIEEEAESLGLSMGDKDVLFMSNHGTLISSPTVHLAFDELYYLEQASKNVVLSRTATSQEHKLKEIPEDTLVQAAKYYNKEMLDFYAKRHFYAYWNLFLHDQPDVFL